ncbi:hypothetical protein FO519_005775 [Halicephalobus sp. NKZ332]|nr:hypothetical protein FO519_005775 [Halicephalobus sp. NKZ332]
MSYPKLISLDEKTQTMKTLFELKLEWVDERLSWNPKDFKNINGIVIKKELIFIPDIIVTNSPGIDINALSRDQYVKLNSTGKVTFSSIVTLTTMCDLHLEDFPFDNQTCSIDFTSFLFNNKDQSFSPQIIADYSYDMGNTEFRVNTLYVYMQLYDQASEQFEMASFVFCLKRNSGFYVLMFVVPMYLCNVFLIFGLFQPITIYDKRRPDKLAIGMAAFVCFVVIGAALGRRIEFSNAQPIIVIYYILQLAFCFFCLTTSITAPMCVLRLNCMQNSHPDPLDVPSPRDEFSLEYEEHLDRMKKRSSVAVDSCMIELRMTLLNINEMLQSKTEAKWRRRVWLTAYGKIELGMFAGLQLLNLTGFSIILHMWN